MSAPWFVVAMGSEDNELFAARCFASAARERDQPLLAWCSSAEAWSSLSGAGAMTTEAWSPAVFHRRLTADDPPVVVLSSSLTCQGPLQVLWSWSGLVVSLETGWVPWVRTSRDFARVDRVSDLLPRFVWQKGIRESGGPFDLHEILRHRTTTHGWASRPRPGEAHEPLVLVALGDRYDPASAPWPDNLTSAVEAVARRQGQLRWAADADPPARVSGLVDVLDGGYEAVEYAVSAAALVIARHRWSIVSLAAQAGTPLLVIGNDRVYRDDHERSWGSMELHALERAGVLSACLGPVPSVAIERRIEGLLDGRKEDPDGVWGAELAVKEIQETLAAR